jgi:hypothetical protein
MQRQIWGFYTFCLGKRGNSTSQCGRKTPVAGYAFHTWLHRSFALCEHAFPAVQDWVAWLQQVMHVLLLSLNKAMILLLSLNKAIISMLLEGLAFASVGHPLMGAVEANGVKWKGVQV